MDVLKQKQERVKRRLICWPPEAPALDPAIDEALMAYIAQRKSALPDTEY